MRFLQPSRFFESMWEEFPAWDDLLNFKESKYFKTEVKDNSLTYQFTLPEGVKPEDIVAEIKDNIVTLSVPLPKSQKEIGRSRRLQLTEKTDAK
jgi:hypothetical protein